MVPSWMAAVPNAYLLFKAWTLPPSMVCSIGELIETPCKEQDLVCETLQSKIEMSDHATVRADKMSALCRRDR